MMLFGKFRECSGNAFLPPSGELRCGTYRTAH